MNEYKYVIANHNGSNPLSILVFPFSKDLCRKQFRHQTD